MIYTPLICCAAHSIVSSGCSTIIYQDNTHVWRVVVATAIRVALSAIVEIVGAEREKLWKANLLER